MAQLRAQKKQQPSFQIQKPDLVVTGMSIPKVTHYIGENLQLSVTIKILVMQLQNL